MGSRLLTQWIALSTLEASEADPELTEWDTKESAKRKAKRKAASGEKWR